MKLSEAKEAIEAVEYQLADNVFCEVCRFERDAKTLVVCITDRLKKQARKGRVWKSKAFLTAFKNASYGFNEEHQRSKGGYDGIFLLDRDFKPRNEMMKKLFKYIDKTDSGIANIAKELNVKADSLLPVRLVSHHMRLLGVISRKKDHDTLVLVDYDDTKF